MSDIKNNLNRDLTDNNLNNSDSLINIDTPMMKQYNELKEQNKDIFLFFRCGDFYEIFGKDAIEASKILDITLTKRQNEIPMCGVPYHSVDVYIAKMINAGKKVAIVEQLEDPKSAKGIVKRGITQIITPGAVYEEKHLNNKNNNYLLCLNVKGLWIEYSYIDISTGDFYFGEIEYDNQLTYFKSELYRILPKEIIIPESVIVNDENISNLLTEFDNILINRFPDIFFYDETNKKLLFTHLGINSYKDLGISKLQTDWTTSGVVLRYLKENLKLNIDHIKKIRLANLSNKMLLDEATIRNLELLRNQSDQTIVNSLLGILDKTLTPMGGRLLKKWIVEPLIDINEINKRLDMVELFVTNDQLMSKIANYLKEIVDLQRLVARLVMDKATPKDLVSLKIAINACNEMKKVSKDEKLLSKLTEKIYDLKELSELIERAIKDEPATFINEGNIVKDGYDKELDEYRKLSSEGTSYLLELENRLRQKFNVPTLKIKYNKIIGYFFELSKNQSANLDDSFIIRQSLVNSCRYTNKELSEYESKILTGQEAIYEIEKRIFYEVRDFALKFINELQINSEIVAEIDVLLSFAKVSKENLYTRPIINDGYSIKIEEARHPVVEKRINYGSFIPNDLEMDENRYVIILTGPNMSGKSTYLRQNALIVLMAQIGCFVPAKSCEIGIVDRIFTRIGSGDNLVRGESTFYVEMAETTNILRNATRKSLIIMDEIGRGTSTYDGLAIAQAILEYIHNPKYIGAKTIFATHYHELTKLEEKKGFVNYSVLVKEINNSITFLHKIINCPSEKSYGIHVAKLTGMPEEVLHYAENLLMKLENRNYIANREENNFEKNLNWQENENNKIHNEQNQNWENLKNKKEFDKDQFEERDLFGFIEEKRKKDIETQIIEKIKNIDINRTTPLQALNILNDLQKKLNK